MADAAAPQRVGWLAAVQRAPASPQPNRFWSWLALTVEPGEIAPRRAGEIEWREHSGGGGSYYVLHNPRSASYLRLSKEEFFIWERLDGRPLRRVLAEYLDSYGRLTAGRALELLNRLRAASMLEQPPGGLYRDIAERLERPSWSRRAERLLKSVVFVEIPLPGAPHALATLYRYGGRLLCTRPGLLLLAIVAVIGLITYVAVVSNRPFEIMTTQGSFVFGFFAFLVANLLASLAAELGRSLATVHFGRRVLSAGLRMLFASPTVFADTRDIAIERRRARIITAASGPFALLVTGGAAGLALLASPPEPFSDGLFKLALLSYGTALFYLNPLVELDGYTLLTEWLEQPDLRQRSFGLLQQQLRKLRQEGLASVSQGRALALFAVLAVVWGSYTALGGIYLIGFRIIAGLVELAAHENPIVRAVSVGLAAAGGGALAGLVAAVLLRLIRQAYALAAQRGLLRRPLTLTASAVWVGALIALVTLVTPLEEALFRAVLAPALLLIAALFNFRLAQDYAGAALRWFFLSLLLWAALIFLAEEVGVLAAALGVTPPWSVRLTDLAEVAGLPLLLAWAPLIARRLSRRFSAPMGLLVMGVLLYALQGQMGESRHSALLATVASWLLTSGVLIFQVVRLLPPAPSEHEIPTVLTDLERLFTAFRSVAGRLLLETEAQAGAVAARTVESRFNGAASRFGWGIAARDGTVVVTAGVTLLETAPRLRQALVVLLDCCAGMIGRPAVERALLQGREGLHWEQREVFDAWVVADLAWWRPADERLPSRAQLEPFLRRVPLFARLSDTELRAIASALRPLSLPVGRAVVRQGEPGDTFYLIRSGVAEVWQRQPGQRERLLATLGECDGFGELALLYDQPRSATVRAATPIELLVMGRADFDRLVRARYEVVAKLGGELERERLLAGMPLLADLSPNEVSRLAEQLEELELPGQTDVVRQGEPGDALYLVREGRLRVTVERAGQEGDQAAAPRELALLGPGEYFGEMALLYDQPRSATVSTIEPARLFVLRKEDFDGLLGRHTAAERELERVSSRRRRVEFERETRAQYGP